MKERKKKQQTVGYAFILPAFVFFLVFLALPIGLTIYWSFFRFGIVDIARPFVGGRNYFQLFAEPVFGLAVRNNLSLIVGSVVVQVGGGLIVAVLLDKGIRRSKNIFLTVYFFPVMMSYVAVGLLWSFVYDPIFGIVNGFLELIGLGRYARGWLGESDTALLAALVTACWHFTGFIILMIFAALQNIPRELYDAARVDGAGGIRCFRYIAIPLLGPVISTAVIVTVIGGFKVFDLIYVLTRGGPGGATEVLATYMYKNAFTLYRMGYASAIATVLLLFTLIATVVQLKGTGLLK